MKRLVMGAIVAAALMMPTRAEAALVYSFTFCQSGFACTTVASNTFSGSYGDYNISLAAGVGVEASPKSTSSTSNLSVTRTGSTNAGQLDVYLTVSNYTLPVGPVYDFDVSLGATGNGTTSAGQTVTYMAYFSATNSTTIPPTGAPSMLASCVLGPSGSPTTSCNNAPPLVVVPGTTPFSLISLTQFFIPIGNTASYGSVGTASITAVPEPGSMILLGTGLLGLAVIARRRLAKQ